MRLRYLIFFLLISFSLFSQEELNFSIKWTQEFEPTTNKNTWTGNNIYVQNESMFLYLNQWKKEQLGSIINVDFNNVVTTEVNDDILGDIDKSIVPNFFNPKFNIVKERGLEFYSIKANAMYKDNNGKIFRVQSFQLTYSLDKETKISINTKKNLSNVVTNSVLSTGTWYKIAINKTGVFKIDKSFLENIGIETSTLNPKKIRLFGNGGAMLPELLSEPRYEDLVENAVYFSGENDGIFDDEDYMLFYGKGPVSWSLRDRNSITHQQNIYSDYAYYFINVDGGDDGKRISNLGIVNNETTIDVNTFTDFIVHEKDLYSYLRAGRKWFGEDFSNNNEQTFTFNFPNIINQTPVIVKSNFSAKSRSKSSTYTVSYNEDIFLKGNILSSGSLEFRDIKKTDFFNSLSEELELKVNWNVDDASAIGYLDYLEVIADRQLLANGKQFGFLNFDSKTSNEVLEYNIIDDENIDYVWNVTDHTSPKNIIDTDLNSTNFKFKENTTGVLEKYQVVNLSDVFNPIDLGSDSKVENQNLHALQDVHYIIITKKELLTQANRIKDYHINNTSISDINSEKINVEVIDIEEIYNEFGSGSPDITAIRDFSKFVYDNSSSEDNRLKYLCLFGDASFDYKNNAYDGGTQIVPNYQSTISNSLSSSYCSDDYYAFLNETDDTDDDGELEISGRLDVVTGRIPVNTITEAGQYVDKLLNYYSSRSRGDWKNKVTLLGDDGQDGSDQSLIQHLEDSSLILEDNNPNLNVLKLYSDAYNEEVTSGGGRYPEITKRFEESFENGALVINYFGHGSTSTLGQEGFLNIETIKSFRNTDNLPMFITVTCDFSRFDDPTFESAGEELIKSSFGGAIGMITTAREITILSGNNMNKSLADYLYSFDGIDRTVAESLKDAKNSVNLSNGNEFFIYYLGDPAMKLSSPKEGVEIINVQEYVTNPDSGNVTLEDKDELNALSKLKVTGRIIGSDSLLLSGFNGVLSITLFDKEIDRQTLKNEGEGNVVEFKSLESKVFVGESSVKNGNFSFDFIIPKDISVSPENGKFSFYAYSDEEERIGSDFTYKVGGINLNAPEDNTPPEIELFMDDNTFLDGGNTSTTPKLLARINDESGINTSLSSIGHDITLVIDGNLANPISLNEFYTTEKDNFTKGIVSYELSELSPGNHTITFKAWDSYNNSSSQTLTFFAQEDKGFELSRVLNYPNPFINHTEFWFKNNRIGDPLEITVQIFTLSGKLIKTIQTYDTNLDDISRVTTWDGKDDFGNKLGKGVYVYKLNVKEIISGESNEKIEKLVIL